VKECGIGSLTIYDIQKQKGKLMKFSFSIKATKAIT
jgi:hypothetical protein